MTAISIEERRRWIGASESAGLLGASPWTTPYRLYHEKRGEIPHHEIEGEWGDAGQFLEPAIAAWAAHKFQWPLEKVEGYSAHPDIEGMGCSCDYRTADGAAPVEIKNVGPFARDGWELDGDVIVDAPLHYLIQVQHQIACTGADFGWLVACFGGNRLSRMRIERHEQTIRRIEAEVALFWKRVAEDNPYPADYAADGAAIAALHAIATPGKVVDMTDHNRLPELVADYRAAADIEKNAAARKEHARDEIREIMGDAEKVLVAGGIAVSAPYVAETQVSYLRKGYRTFRISQKKDKAA